MPRNRDPPHLVVTYTGPGDWIYTDPRRRGSQYLAGITTDQDHHSSRLQGFLPRFQEIKEADAPVIAGLLNAQEN